MQRVKSRSELWQRELEKNQKKIKAVKDTRPYACVRHVRLSPTKAKIVIDTVRGKSYDDAVAILSNMPQDAAAILLKVVKSAGANAEHNKGMNVHDLKLAEVILGAGPTRVNKVYFRGKAHGADRIVTRTSHIKVVLDVKE